MHISGALSSCHSYLVPSSLHTMKVRTSTMCCDLCIIGEVSTGHPSLHKVRVQREVVCRLDGEVLAAVAFWKSNLFGQSISLII